MSQVQGGVTPGHKLNPQQRWGFVGGQSGQEGLPPDRMGVTGKEGLDRLAKEARACAEVNYTGTVLALGCFVSALYSIIRP